LNTAIIDANIIINVWRKEIDPATGNKLYVSSAKILDLIFKEKLRGILLTTTAMEVLHSVRVSAEIAGSPATFAMKKAERELSKSGLLLTIPDAGIMGMAYEMFFDIHTDPYDAIMVATARAENTDALFPAIKN